jgi:EAL domain-containing protein (putative c-di-GMP-specific phosphodiesterase class I)/CheY-like chemotaxis protein
MDTSHVDRPIPDLMLICEPDPVTAAALHHVAERLGCDRVEIDSAENLEALLAVRQPTLAVLAVDGQAQDGLNLLQILARRNARPATLLIGSQDERVLAGVQRFAAARNLHVIATRRRPLDECEIERLLLAHVKAPLPIARAELEHAFAEHEFLLQYQPKVSLGPGGMHIVGVEALVRWRHPRRGVLLPRNFLLAVEQHDLLTQLTDVVITEAIRQAGAWFTQGIRLQVALNLSPRLVQDRDFPARLAALLSEQDLATSQIMLDVTETAGIPDQELIQDVFTRLRMMGVGLSLDNFGTGVSSLSELYRTPFSEVKIDGRLLQDATHDHDAELIVRAVVSLAHQLRLTVCAEGVETAQGLEFVRSAGFDTAQGRLFSGPVAPRQIEELLGELAQSRTAGTGVWRALRSRATRERPLAARGDKDPSASSDLAEAS